MNKGHILRCTAILGAMTLLLASCGQRAQKEAASAAGQVLASASSIAEEAMSEAASALSEAKSEMNQELSQAAEQVQSAKQDVIGAASQAVSEVSDQVGSLISEQSKNRLTMPAATAGATANSFAVFKAVDLDGRTVDQSVLKGHKLTVINFWGTFCPPCIAELPALGALSRSYDSTDVQILGVVVDAKRNVEQYDEDIVQSAKSIVEQQGAGYAHLLPSPDLDTAYLSTVQSIPVTLFVDEAGNILDTHVGARSEKQWRALIDEALAKLP